MKTIYFVRHGESEANVGAPLFQGEESPLTELGKKQAQFIAHRAAKLPIEALVASNTQRTQATAKYIAELTRLPVETEHVFTERRLPSELIGKPRSDPEAAKLYELWERSCFEEHVRAGDGENFTDLKKRVGEAMDYLSRRPEKVLLVVSHGFFLRMFLARIIFSESLTPHEFENVLQAFRTTNTGLTQFEYQPEHGGTPGLEPTAWAVRVWMDRAHLG